MSTTEESAASPVTFHNQQRYSQNQLLARRPSQENDARPRFQVPTSVDTSSESHLYNEDTRRPFTTNDQQQFQPENQFRTRPIDSLERPQDDHFSEEVDQRYQPEQDEQPFHQRTPSTRLKFNQATSDDDIFDGPNQSGPPQGVDEEDTNEFNEDTDYFEPHSRQPHLRSQTPSQIFHPQPVKVRDDQQTSQQPEEVTNFDNRPLQRRPPPTRFSSPQVHRSNFDVPQSVALRPPVVQPTTAAPQPSLSHRGVSGVVPSPPLKRPEPPVRPRPIAVQPIPSADNRQRFSNDDFTQHFRSQQTLPYTRVAADNDFDEHSLPETTTPKPRFREPQVTPSIDHHHFKQFQPQLRPVPIHTTQTSDDVQTFPEKRPAPDHSARPAIQSLIPAGPQHPTSTSSFFSGNVESTGQISPSFVRATEPTRFDEESERPFSEGPFNLTRGIAGALRNRLLTTGRRRLPGRQDVALLGTQRAIESEFQFEAPPPSTITGVVAEFQRPQTHAGQLGRVTVSSVNDPIRRLPTSTPETNVKTSAKLIDRDRSPIINRGSKRGPLLKGRVRVQHVTENTIDDISFQNSVSSRGRDGSQQE